MANKIKNFLKDKSGGLFLVFLAFFIIFGFSLNSRAVEGESKNDSEDIVQVLDGEEVLGEVDEDKLEINDAENLSGDGENTDNIQKETDTDEKAKTDSKTEKYNEIKDYLKKYCDKKGSDKRKKCEKYCREIKGKSQYGDLRKKYCGNEDEESDDQTKNQVTDTAKNELEFIIDSDSGTSQFNMRFEKGETVYELMKEAKAQGKMTYEKNTDETYGVYINSINGIKEGSEADWTKNKYWILYVDGKTSSVGCSSHKLDKSDTSIEWKYEKYSF